MLCEFCKKHFDEEVAERNAEAYHKGNYFACPHCGHPYYVRAIVKFDWVSLDICSKTEDDWGKPITPHRPINYNKPIRVASVDFEDSSISSMDKFVNNIGETVKWLDAIKKEVPNKPFTVIIRDFTIPEDLREELQFEDDFWQYDWLEFKHTVVEEFTM